MILRIMNQDMQNKKDFVQGQETNCMILQVYSLRVQNSAEGLIRNKRLEASARLLYRIIQSEFSVSRLDVGLCLPPVSSSTLLIE